MRILYNIAGRNNILILPHRLGKFLPVKYSRKVSFPPFSTVHLLSCLHFFFLFFQWVTQVKDDPASVIRIRIVALRPCQKYELAFRMQFTKQDIVLRNNVDGIHNLFFTPV